MIEWRYADDWAGRVWRDGVELEGVRAVGFEGEVPVAVIRLVLAPDGRPRLTPNREDVEKEILTGGEFRVELHRRPPGWDLPEADA